MMNSLLPLSRFARAFVTALGVAAAGALILLAFAAWEAHGDVASAGATLTEVTRSATQATAPGNEAEARTFLVERGLASAQVVSPSGVVLVSRGPAARWGAGPASWRAALSGLGAEGWRLRDGVLEAQATFADGTRLTVRTNRRTEHGEVTGISPIILLSLLVGLTVGVLRLRALGRTDRAAAAAASAIAALPGTPPSGLPSRGPWRDLRREIRRAASRWNVSGDHGRPDRLAAILGPLDHALISRSTAGLTATNSAADRLLEDGGDDAHALRTAADALLTRRGPIADRVALPGRTIDLESWDSSLGRVVALADRGEAERMAGLRRRIAAAAQRNLRGPLGEIRRQTDLLHTADDAGAVARQIAAAADRLDSLISRISRGDQVQAPASAPRTIGLAGLLWGMARRWDEDLRTHALRVELDIAPALPEVCADPALIDEVLSELVDNAARFSPRGQAIGLRCEESAKGVLITVHDAGQGFSEEEAGVAHELFWRSDDAMARPGAGLGLGVADALAQRMGGALTVEPGPGGRVSLFLPTDPKDLAAAA